jgi:hypothetical protein
VLRVNCDSLAVPQTTGEEGSGMDVWEGDVSEIM